MKDMLASLPQYQEQREKVLPRLRAILRLLRPCLPVLLAPQHGTRLHGPL